jgi:hypothetical protein
VIEVSLDQVEILEPSTEVDLVSPEPGGRTIGQGPEGCVIAAYPIRPLNGPPHERLPRKTTRRHRHIEALSEKRDGDLVDLLGPGR